MRKQVSADRFRKVRSGGLSLIEAFQGAQEGQLWEIEQKFQGDGLGHVIWLRGDSGHASRRAMFRCPTSPPQRRVLKVIPPLLNTLLPRVMLPREGSQHSKVCL